MAKPEVTAAMIKNLEKYNRRILELNEAMSKTDSDMFEYFATLEQEELEKKIAKINRVFNQ